MNPFTLTNTTKEFIALIEERGIEYNTHEANKSLSGLKSITIWIPNAQYLFELAQEYENIRNTVPKENAHVDPVFGDILNSIKPPK